MAITDRKGFVPASWSLLPAPPLFGGGPLEKDVGIALAFNSSLQVIPFDPSNGTGPLLAVASFSGAAHQWVTGFDSKGLPLTSQPSAADIAGLAGGAPGVSSLNGQTGALVGYSPPQGRLTLTSGVAVPSASVAGAATVYYTPAVGSIVPVYDGTHFVPTPFAELSQTTTDTTKSPAAVAASSLYDIFVWNDAGTIRATRGPAWTNDTTRSAGTALVLVGGIYLNNAVITNGPAAQRGTYVGTIRSNASSTIDFIFGTAAAGGGAAFFYVWNLYNQAYFQTEVNDTTASWTYASATVRAANNSTSNRISFVSGLAINGFNGNYQDTLSVPGVINAYGFFGVSLDTTAALQKYSRVINNTTTGALAAANSAVGVFPAQIGAHFLQAVEASDGTNTATFQGQGAGQSFNAGLWQ